MVRESQIPLFLWLATAILVHLTWAGGTDRVVSVLEERLLLRDFAFSVRKHVQAQQKPLEVAVLGLEERELPEEHDGRAAAPHDTAPESSETLDDADETEVPAPSIPQEKRQPAPEALEQEATPPVEPEPKAPEPKPDSEPEPKLELLPEEKPPPERRELVPPDQRRVAVEQHVENESQDENPDAEFMADHANHVEEQTQARLTNTEEHQSNTPTVSGAHSGPGAEPGNSDETTVAQLEDAPGERGVAPDQNQGVRAQEARGVAPARIGAAHDAQATSERAHQAVRATPGRQPQDQLQERPDTLRGGEGQFALQDARPAQDARQGRQARGGLPDRQRSRSAADLLGLGATGTTENGINLSLSHQAALDTLGPHELERARRRDAERRRSEHRGSMQIAGLERWRSAIENYVPSVKLGNQTALNTARVPFASYINRVHNRIHPIFAGQFLGSLDQLPASHPLRQPGLSTSLEIVVSQLEGRLVRMGVVKSSGVMAFDLNALDSVHRAAPFGPAPREITSPDGNVYLHWEFHKYPYACGTFNARPFLLKPEPGEAPPPAPKPRDGEEQHPADMRKQFGWRVPLPWPNALAEEKWARHPPAGRQGCNWWPEPCGPVIKGTSS